MFRDRGKAAPHNLFGHADALIAKGGSPVPPPPLFSYVSANEAFAGDPVAAFSVGFEMGYDVSYAYDAASRTWQRSMGGAPFTDASGQQVAPTNVVVQFTDYPAESEGQTVGQGDAWVFADGKVARGRWNRPQREQPAQYVDAAGNPIKLLPGTTWVELLPTGLSVNAIPPATPPAPDTTPPPTSAPPTTKKRK
jgi:hypothetical protein